jgi:endoglucanase
MNVDHRRLLKLLLSLPTAPFRELHILGFAVSVLDRAGIPWLQDPAGNLVIGVRSMTEYRRLLQQQDPEPVRVFIAHMDHPGFHGARWLSSKRLAVKWHGGSPVRHLRGARVWLADDTGYIAQGKITNATLLPSRHAIDSAEIRLAMPVPASVPARTVFGGFGFRAPVWSSGKTLYTQAADDLVGVYAVLAIFLKLHTRKQKTGDPMLGLLTRGEETGFVGAIAHLERGWLQSARRPVLAVSLETSRTLPGARIGRGPVVRLGDRRTVFDPDALAILIELAERLLPGKHQRRIMDSGTCEASAAIAYGLTAIGLSVPLGNYHNQGLEGGPDCRGPQGPAPEFVHLDDIDGLVSLCAGLMRKNLPWTDAWRKQRARLRKNAMRYRRHL